MPPKRPAASQGGPSKKRAALGGSGHIHHKPVSKVTTDVKGKKRAQPITKPLVVAESATEEEDDSEREDELDTLPLDEEEVVQSATLKDAVGHDQSRNNEASRAARKELLQHRKATKSNSELLARAKKLWSLARQNSIGKDERQKHLKELMEVVRGHVQEIVFKHDASRIIQTLVKLGGKEERSMVAVELKGKYKDLAQNKYSKFLVTKLVRYCPSHRSSIMSEFHKHVLRLLLHREASQVIADAFELYCTSADRALLLQDFYGKEVALFDSDKVGKEGLKGVLEGATLERRRRVLAVVKENLMNIFNNPDKGAVSFLIVHRATWEYLQELEQLEDEAEKERLRRELYENCQELLAEFVHTRDGARVVREFLAQGNAKDRKQIIKTLKPHMERICKDEEAQLVLLTALEVVDDTKMLAKTIIADITALAPTLAFDKHKLGRRVLLSLLVPRSPRHFTPATLAVISETDAARSKTSKKDPQVRNEEIRKAASPDLIKCVETTGEDMMKDPGASLVLLEIMLYADGDKSAATQVLLKPLQDLKASGNSPEAKKAFDDSTQLPRLYKTLIQGGHYNRETASVVEAPSWSAVNFATAFFGAAGGPAIVEMAKGSGAFLVTELLSILQGTGAGAELRTCFTEDVQREIRDSQVKGKEALLEKLGYSV